MENDFICYEVSVGSQFDLLVDWLVGRIDRGADLRLDSYKKCCLVVVPREDDDQFRELFFNLLSK